MTNPGDIERRQAESREAHQALTEKVLQIKSNETAEIKSKRKKMGLSWHKKFPLLVSRWHVDNCVYDGVRLEKVCKAAPESASIGGLEMGISFLPYSFFKYDHGEHFEQCPSCKVIYQMGPSPEDLEAVRKYKPDNYREVEE